MTIEEWCKQDSDLAFPGHFNSSCCSLCEDVAKLEGACESFATLRCEHSAAVKDHSEAVKHLVEAKKKHAEMIDGRAEARKEFAKATKNVVVPHVSQYCCPDSLSYCCRRYACCLASRLHCGRKPSYCFRSRSDCLRSRSCYRNSQSSFKLSFGGQYPFDFLQNYCQ